MPLQLPPEGGATDPQLLRRPPLMTLVVAQGDSDGIRLALVEGEALDRAGGARGGASHR